MSPPQIHNCDVIGEIGSGGMAIIYKAVQNSLNRPVAIKELKSDFINDPQVIARFLREATALAMLQHQNIVHIYDFAKEDDNFRMIMEYVEGVDLFDLLEEVHRLPSSIGLLIGYAICSALEYAHYRGIIHRDIKPSNIIISRKGEIKLMDFGIARDENLGDLTRPGTSLGTPAYMSPEQVMGVKTDFRSDIFSLGVVLYQMFTGSKPFREGGGKSLMHKILHAEFTKPRKLNPNLPRKIENIILRCMARESVDRYHTTGQLRQELESCLAQQINMNYSGRMVTFLFHKKLVSREEAETFVNPRFLADAELIRQDENLPPSLSISSIAWVQGALGASLVLWILIIHLIMGSANGQTPATMVHGPPGALKVVIWPWAEIFIDGAYMETSPVARSFSLSPGMHELTLKNPHFKTITAKVLIEPGVPIKRKFRLERRNP